VFTEVLRDVSIALAPVSKAKARKMIDGLRSRRMLDGFRGAPPADAEAVADAVARASELLADGADWIAELDVNPLIAGPDRVAAADALIVRKEG
jgi:hypothetical protein